MPDVITCTSEGDDPSGRGRQGVDRPDDAPAGPAHGCELGATTRETHAPAVAGNPCASRMIPLESPVPEIGTPGSESGGRKRAYGLGLRPGRESAGRATEPYRLRASPRLYNDEQIDFAVFDAGVYVGEESVGYGNPPQLWLSDNDGVLRSSESLADAVRAEHALRPPTGKGLSAPADLHIKSAAAGDIDNDGDLDLWVENTGGKNVVSHFMVNNGDETFTIERDRATDAVFRNNPPDYWRHVGNSFVDVDNDGDLDLALGQIQDDGLAWRPYSIVVVNDGTGHYPSRIELPDPAFNDGHTAAQALTHFDVNSDGFKDLLLVHERDGHPEVLSFTGRYIQVLINDDGEAFVDETSTWMGDQSLTTPELYPNGDGLHNAARPRMLDIDRDGCEDIVMANANTRPESPIFYLNNGSGQFQPVDPGEMFTGMDWLGIYSAPADVNGDGVIDLVFPQRILGPDDEYGTDDDSTRFLTLLNTTPAGPVRCSPRVTAVTAVAEGATTITVTASGAYNSIATQQFKATATAFTSAPARRSRSGLWSRSL